MELKETGRQKKFSSLLKKELAHLFQDLLKKEKKDTLILSITKVIVSPDLSLAKIYVSIFPSTSNIQHIESIRANSSLIKHNLSRRLKSNLRKVPSLNFCLDDSLDYIQKIDEALKNPYNPIKSKKE